MSRPDYTPSGKNGLKDPDPGLVIQAALPRTRYALLYEEYQDLAAAGLLKNPLRRKHAKAWAHVQSDFEDALFELLPCSGLGTVILAPGDTRTEHTRVTNAIICLHDWLRLYQEIIRQQPPLGLLKIEQDLCDRREELNRFYPPAAHQPD